MKIMIVEDDQTFSEFIKKYIKNNFSDCEIMLANSGKEFLNIINKENINLAFIDIKLPDADGLKLLERIKENKKNIEVVIITGYPDPETKKKALEKGAASYLVKPVSLKEIHEVISYIREKNVDNEWSGVSLIDVLQFLSYQRDIWEIEVFKNKDFIGKIFVDNGLIKGAKYGKEQGLNALYKLLDLKGISHRIKKTNFLNLEHPEEINQPVELLILQYIKELDEMQQKEDEIPQKSFIKKLSEELKEVKGFFIMDKKGKFFETNLDIPLSSGLNLLLKKTEELSNLLFIKNLNFLICEYENGKLGMVKIPSEDIYMGIITTSFLNFGMLKIVLEDIYNFSQKISEINNF